MNHDSLVTFVFPQFKKVNREVRTHFINVFSDHITSPSAIVLPIKKLINLCRKYNVISVVDGAHAPGQIKLSMREYAADFYCGKHKVLNVVKVAHY